VAILLDGILEEMKTMNEFTNLELHNGNKARRKFI